MEWRVRIVTGAAVVVIVSAAGVVGGSAVLNVVRQAQGCEGIEAYLHEYGLVTRSEGGVPGVAVLGDSYTAGLGLQDPTEGWAFQVGSRVAGVGGTGFVTGGYRGEHSFGERIGDVLATDPETLIIQGGLNDIGRSPDTVRDAAAVLLEAAEGVSQVVVVGPVDAPATEGETVVDAALSEAARAAGREYVSGLDRDLQFLPDDLHLTQGSHDELARHVAERAGLHRHGTP